MRHKKYDVNWVLKNIKPGMLVAALESDESEKQIVILGTVMETWNTISDSNDSAERIKQKNLCYIEWMDNQADWHDPVSVSAFLNMIEDIRNKK